MMDMTCCIPDAISCHVSSSRGSSRTRDTWFPLKDRQQALSTVFWDALPKSIAFVRLDSLVTLRRSKRGQYNHEGRVDRHYRHVFLEEKVAVAGQQAMVSPRRAQETKIDYAPLVPHGITCFS